ncbi:hypothetical protein GobsT_19600 [Gemmata obscuriglobus]|uniref:DUF1569 domain-containing protein n=1 Tax=Gemmata obscuriglobus TaxID=114 RepID=A0A2Z3H7Y9_9BACT|nr:DUF1569 domain-containing protein [Gemmata obscuriglobus]AWM39686.1 DUF1569 domain-containing protein [Gemmata obscuriglobus]QEG27206.1 hypothetical protein GobsT_19600 [Gemmata obscuriglobus]VTS03917.1 Uncharacterized protein OS=Planctomyces maris DSM 8797 GN=PM8797T_05085 PE=4 SV=1: DUF1569 [Gemmata obscuriglobus UQM 2246]
MSSPKAIRRKVPFATLDEAVADAENLLAKGYVRAGNWDLAQVCFHLAEWLRYPIEGFPKPPLLMRPVFWLARSTIAPRMLQKTLAKGEMPPGAPTLKESVAPPGSDPSIAVAKLKEAVERFKAFPGPYRPSPLLGVLDRETGHKVQRLHCAHHLSFLIPQA